MSRQTYEEYLTEPGTPVSLADVGRWDWHRRTCSVCSVSKYSYTRCPEGLRLAKVAVQKGESQRDGIEAGEEPARPSALGLQSQPEPLSEGSGQ